MCPFRIDFLFGAICLNFPVNSIIDAINSTSIGKPEYAKARPGKDGGRLLVIKNIAINERK